MVRNGAARFEGAGGVSVPLRDIAGVEDGQPIVIGLRPEHLRLSDQGIDTKVIVVEPTGSEVQLIGRSVGGDEIVANFRDRTLFEPGQQIRLSADPNLIHVFHGETGKRLGD